MAISIPLGLCAIDFNSFAIAVKYSVISELLPLV
jgi:hypothetical protein